MERKLKQKKLNWTPYEIVWMLFFYMLIIVACFIGNEPILNLVATLTGIANVMLVAKGKRSNYYFGMINTLLAAIIAWKLKYYGLVGLNLLYYFPSQVIGLIVWTRNLTRLGMGAEISIRVLTKYKRILIIAGTLIAITGYGFLLKHFNGNYPFLDASATIIQVVGVFLMASRYVDQWLWWISAALISLVLWSMAFLHHGGGFSLVIMWIGYLSNAIYGLIRWIKLYRAKNQQTTVPIDKIVI